MRVDIVTPNRKLVDGIEAQSVKLPAHRGELEILPGHADLLTLLSTGILNVQIDGTSRKFAISYGLAEVRNDRLIVLAETAEEGKDIDLTRAKTAQKKAQGELGAVLSEENFKKYQLKLQRSLVRQQVAGGFGGGSA